MLSALLSLALLRADVPVGSSAALVPPWSSADHVRIAETKTPVVRPAAEHVDGERDCIDENDDSDESSFSMQRTEKFGASMSRTALVRFRTQLEKTAAVPREVSLPLFYAFCRLLL